MGPSQLRYKQILRAYVSCTKRIPLGPIRLRFLLQRISSIDFDIVVLNLLKKSVLFSCYISATENFDGNFFSSEICLLIQLELRGDITNFSRMAPEEKTLVEILEEHSPIDISKYITYVSAPEAGAIATFSGTTRDNFEGKTVVELRYEAYVPMALRCIKSICTSARSSWNLHSIAVAHRLGPVPVGETSVFIAISAVHRADALDSCRFVIDEIKASVPIWKKEVYDNGEVWKENSEFINRRLELGKKDADQNENEVEVPMPSRKSCCGTKVKGNEESRCIGSDHEGNSKIH